VSRNLSTSSFSRLLSDDRDCAADSTCEEILFRFLLFDSRSDRRGNFRQPLDRPRDVLDGADRVLRRRLDAGDLLADLAGCLGGLLGERLSSEATTAKPRPASPARAASMVALSASRLVWPAMVLISSTTSPMRLAAFDNSLTRSVVVRA